MATNVKVPDGIQTNSSDISVFIDDLKKNTRNINSVSLFKTSVCNKIVKHLQVHPEHNTQELFNVLMNSIVSALDTIRYYQYDFCYCDEFIKLYGLIFTNSSLKIPSFHIKKISGCEYLFPFLNKYAESCNVIFTASETKDFIEGSSRLSRQDDTSCIQKFMSGNHFTFSDDTLEYATSRGQYGFVKTAIQNKVIFPQKSLGRLFENADLDLCKIAIVSGCKPDIFALKGACTSGNIDKIKFVLNSKIVPTKECFDALITAAGKVDHQANRYNRIHNTGKTIVKNSATTCIDLLRSHGYKLTYDDVLAATRAMVVINDIDKLGLTLDKRLMDVCSENSFYPYTIKGLEVDVKCLQQECKKSGNINIIRDIMKKGVVPDIECLKNASTVRTNIQVIKLLIEKGGISPDLDCVKNFATASRNSTLTYLLNAYSDNIGKEKPTDKIVGVKTVEKPIKSKSSKSGSVSITSTSVESAGVGQTSTKSNTGANKIIIKSDSESSSDSSSELDSDSATVLKTAVYKSKLSASTNSKNTTTSTTSTVSAGDIVGKTNVKSANQKSSDVKNTVDKNTTSITKSTVPKRVSKSSSSESSSESESESGSESDSEHKANKKSTITKADKLVRNGKESGEKSDSKSEKSVEPVDLMQSIPVDFDYRKKTKLNDKIAKALKIKSVEYSFIEFRKIVMAFLSKKNSIKSTGIIDIPAELVSVSHVKQPEKKSPTVNLTDIDKYVYSLFSFSSQIKTSANAAKEKTESTVSKTISKTKIKVVSSSESSSDSSSDSSSNSSSDSD